MSRARRRRQQAARNRYAARCEAIGGNAGGQGRMNRAILHAFQGGAGGAHSFMIELTAVAAEVAQRIALFGEAFLQLPADLRWEPDTAPILMGRANGKTSAYLVQAFRPGGLVPPITGKPCASPPCPSFEEHTLEVLPLENDD